MDNNKTDELLTKIIEDIQFSMEHLEGVSPSDFNLNEVLNNAIRFKFIQISENAKKLPQQIVLAYPNIPWVQITGLRNKIVHDYGKVDLEVIYNTVINDFPKLLINLVNICNEAKAG